MKIGYVRVSTKEQHEDRQVETMRKLGVEERFLFIDKATGKNFERPEYKKMKMILREGDVLYLDSLDRLGRNYDLVRKEWHEITAMGCDIVCIDMQEIFNTIKFREMGDMGKVLQDMMLSVLSYVAEQELKKNHERQAQGIAIAKAKGVHIGRKPAVIDDKFFTVANAWKNGNMRLCDAIKESGLAEPTFFKYCRKYGIKKEVNS